MIHRSAACLLGAHVRGSPDELAGQRLIRIQRGCFEVAWVAGHGPLGQPKIQHFHLTALIEADIGRFEIAMHNPPLECRGQGIGYLHPDSHHLRNR